MRTRFLLYVILAATFALVLVSCSRHRPVVYSSTTPPVVIAGGPPPHAPAHGYRIKHHQGVVLIYDSKLGAYVVQGFPGHYYREEHFFRREGHEWQVAIAINGPWAVTTVDRLPEGLKKLAKEERKASKSAAKGRGRDKHW